MIKVLLFITLLPNLLVSGTKTDYERLMEIMTKELTHYKELARLKTEQVRIVEAVSIAKSERMKVFRRRDRTVVRINGFKRVLKHRNEKYAQMMTAYYKISRSAYGRTFIEGGTTNLSMSGTHSMKMILRREAMEIAAVKSGLTTLVEQKKLLQNTLASYDTIIEKIALRNSELDAAVARCESTLKTLAVKRQTFPRTLFDATSWKVWAQIVSIRKKFGGKILPFVANRGIMERPVPGAYLVDRTDSKGVYLSAKPGMNVRAPEGGIVRYTGKVKGYGEVVVVEHRESYYSLIGRLDNILVKTGEHISRGHVIAKAAILGNAPYVPVYYELRKGTTYLNPKLWLR